MSVDETRMEAEGGSGRPRSPPLHQLRQEHTQKSDAMNELLAIEVGSLSVPELREWRHDVRKTLYQLSKLCRDLSRKLVASGVIAEAEELYVNFAITKNQHDTVYNIVVNHLRDKGEELTSIRDESVVSTVREWLANSTLNKTIETEMEPVEITMVTSGADVATSSVIITMTTSTVPITTVVSALTTPAVSAVPVHAYDATANPNFENNYRFDTASEWYNRPRAASSFVPSRQPTGNTGGYDHAGAHYDCITRKEMLKESVFVFKGQAGDFLAWQHTLCNYAQQAKLSPIDTLRYMANKCTGDAHTYLKAEIRLHEIGARSEELDDIWVELKDRFGAPELVADELQKELKDFPQIQDPYDGIALRRLHDLCRKIGAGMKTCPELEQFNLSTGTIPIREKLPTVIQMEWAKIGIKFKKDNGQHPPFSIFLTWLHEEAKARGDRGFEMCKPETRQPKPTQPKIRTAKVLATNAESSGGKTGFDFCYMHKIRGHSTDGCQDFTVMSPEEKKAFAEANWLCLKCLRQHVIFPKCKYPPICATCGAGHATSMHLCQVNAPKEAVTQPKQTRQPQKPKQKQQNSSNTPSKAKPTEADARCTIICGDEDGKKNSRIFMVDMTKEGSSKSLRGYAFVDEQASKTLIPESLPDYFGGDYPTETLKVTTVMGSSIITSRMMSGLKVRGIYCDNEVKLPVARTCGKLVDNRKEYASQIYLNAWTHTIPYAKEFPPYDPDLPVIALIARDCPVVLPFQCLTTEAPFVGTSVLGYALLGDICPEKTDTVTAYRTEVSEVKGDTSVQLAFLNNPSSGFDVFSKRRDDEEVGLSQEDKQFLTTVSNGARVDEDGNLEIPLPFRYHEYLPNKAGRAFRRTESILSSLKSNPSKLEGCLDHIKRSLENGHIEQVPFNEVDTREAHTLPVHIVTHPKKGKHRVVVDPTGSKEDKGLNSMLLTGPNLINEMTGVFLRFRESRVGFGADVADMFLNFRIPQKQRDFVRFYWFRDNNPEQGLVPYRYKSHPFGLSSSPGVANFALQLCAHRPMPRGFLLAQDYLKKSFYVDDGLASADSVDQGIEILRNAQAILSDYNVRLHKIMSNEVELLQAFPKEDVAEASCRSLDEDASHSVLGTSWDTVKDTIMLNVSIQQRPFTKRGVLSHVGSIFDRNGLVCPVTLRGRLFMRKIMPPKKDGECTSYSWDEQLPDAYRQEYSEWLESLKDISLISIPRCLGSGCFQATRTELHVFCDASSDSIGFIAYLRSVGRVEEVHVAFLNASSKVAPRMATSIPRLELNAAVEAAANATFIRNELSRKPSCVYLYSDSMVVMGYLRNTEKRFARYVERRVNLVLSHSTSDQWYYVHTTVNPADIATRPHTPRDLLETIWFPGPEQLMRTDFSPEDMDTRPDTKHQVSVLPEEITEEMALQTTARSMNSLTYLVAHKFSWLHKILAVLKVWCVLKSKLLDRVRCINPNVPRKPLEPHEVLTLAIRQAQEDSYHDILPLLERKEPLPAQHKMASLSPFVDKQNVLRVGGRLQHSDLTYPAKHPVLLHKDHPFTVAVVWHYHRKCQHSGGRLTLATLRQEGFYIMGGGHFVQKLVKDCLICRRLRGPPLEQIMSDLPNERLQQSPPFQNVGIDVFGHFFIKEGVDTRRNASKRKIWVLIIVCMPSRAVHLEALPAMTSSVFMNAFARFTALRGNPKTIRSDNGSNFLGAINEMKGLCHEDLSQRFLQKGIKWVLNPPHASHMGGVWERKIGSVRRVMEAAFALAGNRLFTHDEFVTILAESADVVNSTPLWAVSADPNDPLPLTPNHLLRPQDGDPRVSQEEYDESDLLKYGKLRYRKVQYLVEHFWFRWKEEYIHSLTARRKWTKPMPSLQVGDVVLLREKNVRRNEWPAGVVTEVKRSKDNLVRSATVRLRKSDSSGAVTHLTRPISKMVMLVSARDRSGSPRDPSPGGVSC